MLSPQKPGSPSLISLEKPRVDATHMLTSGVSGEADQGATVSARNGWNGLAFDPDRFGFKMAVQ
jgi:hypothetical protein